MRRTSFLIALALVSCSAPQAKTDNSPTADNAEGQGMMAHASMTAQNDEFLYQEQIYPAVMAVAKNRALKADRPALATMHREMLIELQRARQAFQAHNLPEWEKRHAAFYRKAGELVAALTKATGGK